MAGVSKKELQFQLQDLADQLFEYDSSSKLSRLVMEKLAYALEYGSVMIDYMELQKFLKKPKVKKKSKGKG